MQGPSPNVLRSGRDIALGTVLFDSAIAAMETILLCGSILDLPAPCHKDKGKRMAWCRNTESVYDTESAHATDNNFITNRKDN